MKFNDMRYALEIHLSTIYNENERLHIAKSIFSKLTKTPYEAVHSLCTETLDKQQQDHLDRYIKELSEDKPIQYILEEAYFCQIPFYVNENVLIPRIETQQIIPLVEAYLKTHNARKCLDVGTGSGCIAISLKNHFPNLDIVAIDKSSAAIEVAKKNSVRLGLAVVFEQADMCSYEPSTPFDIIVSNPPYILEEEKKDMQPQVVNFEPAQALYTPKARPLHYYQALLKLAQLYLRTDGFLCMELHEERSEAVAELVARQHFQCVKIESDYLGKKRFLYAIK